MSDPPPGDEQMGETPPPDIVQKAQLDMREETLKAQEEALTEREANLDKRERKSLLAALGCQTDEDAAKFDGKNNMILKELVEYKSHIKAQTGGIPSKVQAPVKPVKISTNDGMSFKQKVRNPSTGEWTQL